jgi:hypothetical protein
MFACNPEMIQGWAICWHINADKVGSFGKAYYDETVFDPILENLQTTQSTAAVDTLACENTGVPGPVCLQADLALEDSSRICGFCTHNFDCCGSLDVCIPREQALGKQIGRIL